MWSDAGGLTRSKCDRAGSLRSRSEVGDVPFHLKSSPFPARKDEHGRLACVPHEAVAVFHAASTNAEHWWSAFQHTDLQLLLQRVDMHLDLPIRDSGAISSRKLDSFSGLNELVVMRLQVAEPHQVKPTARVY